MKRKICVVTATRAEYGAMRCLLEEIDNDPDLILQLIVTGTHLSPEFGYTLKEIEADGYHINKKIEMLLSSDSAIGVSKSMGLAQISFAEAYDELNPDLVVVIGDRYELIPIVSAANIARIPVAHISGGELTEGAIDEIFRHAVTKLSHIHFTSIQEYADRVVRMGEHPSRVYTVGEPGLDNIKRIKLLSKTELEGLLGIKFKQKNLLITYHPETCESLEAIRNSFADILKALVECKDTQLIFTKSNADVGGREINKMIDEFVALNGDRAAVFTSLGQLKYLSVLQFVDAVVGNSSSGIVEVPSFKVATINIGGRQKGRIRAASTLDVEPYYLELKNVFETIYEPTFKNNLRNVINPYEQPETCKKIKDIIKALNFSQLKIKSFYDF